MKPRFVAPVLGATVVLVTCLNARTADLERPVKAALALPADIVPTFVSFAPDAGMRKLDTAVQPPATPRFTVAVLQPRLDAMQPTARSELAQFSGQVQQAGFDLDLTRLYRTGAASAPVVPLRANPAAANGTPDLSTWDMPFSITPADHNLASRLQTRADAALATRIALATTTDVK